MTALKITVDGKTSVIQLGSLSPAVNQQITQAVSSAQASAAAAAASAASIPQLFLGVFATDDRPNPTATGQFGVDTTNGFVVVSQITPTVVWTNSAGLPV